MSTISEEITARVARMLFEQIVRGLDFGSDLAKDVYKIGEASIKDGAGTLKTIGKNLRDSMGDKEFQRLLEEGTGHISTGQMDELIKRCNVNPSNIKIANENVERFEGLLNEAGIMYAKVDIKEDNCRMFVFLDTETDRVENLAKIIYAEKGQLTELSPELFLQTETPKTLREISGLDAVELELFRHYAKKKNDFLFTVVPTGDNKNTVFVNTSRPKSANSVQRTMTEMGWALSGRNGARVREQLEYRIAGRTAILKSIDDAMKELYIVSKDRPGDFVHISSDEFQIYNANNMLKNVVKRENNTEEFRDECLSWCEKLKNPVILGPEEFNNGISVESLSDKRTLELFAPDFDEMIERQMMGEMVHLVQQGIERKRREQKAIEKEIHDMNEVSDKMALDNEGNAEVSYWDETVSYSEFAYLEDLADEEQRKSREYQFEHFKDAAFYSKRNFETKDHIVDKNLDVVIELAEQKRRDREAAAAKMRDDLNKEKQAREENNL